MPIKATGLITAYTLFLKEEGHKTWKYICRACLERGEVIKMAYKEIKGEIWIYCPQCNSEPEKLSCGRKAEKGD